jgi:hypothetical protein
MKTTGYFAVVLFLCLTATAFGKEESTLKDNEYGGITKVVTFSEKDAEYKKGVKKVVTAYDEMKNKIMVEVYATKIHIEKEGWDKTTTYYWGETTIGEVHSTDSHSEIYGFDKMVNFYDKNNLLYKREYYLRKESIVAKLGVYKRVVHYDNNGRKTESEDLDRVGNVIKISLEDYKAVTEKQGQVGAAHGGGQTALLIQEGVAKS